MTNTQSQARLAGEQQSVITLELCGKLADLAGPELRVPIGQDGATLSEILARLADHRELQAELAKGRTKFCVNESMADPEQRIMAGDVVALFPPVSGG